MIKPNSLNSCNIKKNYNDKWRRKRDKRRKRRESKSLRMKSLKEECKLREIS
jgi:hypothetical protein